MPALADLNPALADLNPALADLNTAEPKWAVRVDCAELSAEDRAEIEVRHLVELETLQGAPQTLVLSCNETSVSGGWEHQGQVVSQKLVTRAKGDNLLELHHWLASMLASVGPGNLNVEPEVGASGAAPAQVEPNGAGSPPKDVPPVLATTPVDGTTSGASLPPKNSRSDRPGELSSSSRALLHPWRVGFGGTYEHWGSEVPGAAGFLLDGSFTFHRPLALHASASYSWAIGDAAGFSARAGALGLHLEAEILPYFAVLAGPLVSLTELYDAQDGTRAAYNAVTLGGELFGRLNLPVRGLGAFLALGVRGLVSERRIRLNGEDQLSVPAVQGLFVLGAEWGER
jgi:hypothetical protein